jgi:hypothetical protein
MVRPLLVRLGVCVELSARQGVVVVVSKLAHRVAFGTACGHRKRHEVLVRAGEPQMNTPAVNDPQEFPALATPLSYNTVTHDFLSRRSSAVG